MTYRIVDRIVIWTGTAASVFVLCGGHPGAADIAVILVSFILGIACELKRNELIAILCAAAVFISSFFLPGMALVMPTAVYSLAICNTKLERVKSIAFRGVAGGAMALAVALADISLTLKAMTLLISGLAFYLAFKTGRHENTEENLRAKYDDARWDSLNAQKLREETMKNADNEVYMARLKERNRIAREIHDNVGHMITRVIVQLQALKIINKDPGVGE